MWFDTWHDLIRIVAVGAASYVSLVLILRISGNRTLAKLSAFDFVITIAIGSSLATILLDRSTTWAEGVAALVTLIMLQFLIASLTSWTRLERRLVTAAPVVLLRNGVVDLTEMRRQRISIEELRQAVRSSGTGDLSDLAAVVLETDGTMSVISRSRAGDLSALEPPV